ncbi:VOC family protein [Algihabitans albus]|uniref:VOC family protein n=1 Tax=Algihabitans albus TaxID=2164067 RepID=UPI001F46C62B|nr:VOC family protein [Algihabitans albus]
MLDQTGGRSSVLQLDHLTVIAPSLAEGVDHVRACLDLDIPYGGTHPQMGTHNHLLRLGDDVYLEVIAVDPKTPAPSGPRWFGLGDAETVRSDWADGRRLRGWVVRTTRIDAVLAEHGDRFGKKIRGSRGGRYFLFSLLPDGSLPLNGALPPVIDRGDRPPPATRMEDQGARLTDVLLEHPSPDEIARLYAQLQIGSPPLVREGPIVRYSAKIDTPSGMKVLQ